MLKINIYIKAFLFLFFIFIIINCAKKNTIPIKEEIYPNETASYKLLIGFVNGETTNYKNEFFNYLIPYLNKEWNIRVINLNNINEINKKNYDAFLIVDYCKYGMIFSRKFKKIAKSLDKEKLVYFITSGDPNWKYSYNGIDAITGASVKTNNDYYLKEIVNKLNAIVNKK